MVDLAPIQKVLAELDRRLHNGTLRRNDYFSLVFEGRRWLEANGRESDIDIFLSYDVPAEWMKAITMPLPEN